MYSVSQLPYVHVNAFTRTPSFAHCCLLPTHTSRIPCTCSIFQHGQLGLGDKEDRPVPVHAGVEAVSNTQMHTPAHTHTHTHRQIHSYTYFFTPTNIHTLTRTHTHRYTSTYTHTHTNSLKHTHTHTHTHTHIYTCTRTRSEIVCVRAPCTGCLHVFVGWCVCVCVCVCVHEKMRSLSLSLSLVISFGLSFV